MHRLASPDMSWGHARFPALGFALAIGAALGIAALLTVVPAGRHGIFARAPAQSPVGVNINRRLKGDRLDVPPSDLVIDSGTTPGTTVPKLPPATPGAPTKDQSIEVPGVEAVRPAGVQLTQAAAPVRRLPEPRAP